MDASRASEGYVLTRDVGRVRPPVPSSHYAKPAFRLPVIGSWMTPRSRATGEPGRRSPDWTPTRSATGDSVRSSVGPCSDREKNLEPPCDSSGSDCYGAEFLEAGPTVVPKLFPLESLEDVTPAVRHPHLPHSSGSAHVRSNNSSRVTTSVKSWRRRAVSTSCTETS
jgi:hypothetical protein